MKSPGNLRHLGMNPSGGRPRELARVEVSTREVKRVPFGKGDVCPSTGVGDVWTFLRNDNSGTSVVLLAVFMSDSLSTPLLFRFKSPFFWCLPGLLRPEYGSETRSFMVREPCNRHRYFLWTLEAGVGTRVSDRPGLASLVWRREIEGVRRPDPLVERCGDE